MNPSRLHRLFDERFRTRVRSGHGETQSDGTRYVDLSPMPDDESGAQLAAYFTTGGG